MTPQRPDTVSVIEPIGPAIEKVKTILFNPFDLSKWFIIGFCAWLAQLGSANRGGGGGGSGGNGDGDEEEDLLEPLTIFETLGANAWWWAPLAVLGVILAAYYAQTRVSGKKKRSRRKGRR